MATRGQQKQRSNATLSKAELTKLEKEAEKRSARRRANVAKNKAAGNAGLSSTRLNRMEAEAERKSAERRNARTAAQSPAQTPSEAKQKASTRSTVAKNTRGPQKPAPKGVIGGGSISDATKRTASRVGRGARALTGLGAALTVEEVGRGSDVVPAGRRDEFVKAQDAKNKKNKGQAKSTPSKAKDSKEKNYNVGVSKGGVSFNEAFRHFRNKGAKTFTWNGKKYTTELKKKEK